MATKHKSAFREWFELQFGKCPTNKPMHKLREECDQISANLTRVQHELMMLEEYEKRKTAAHYAWIARESILKEKR